MRKILFQVRANAISQPGGDTILLNHWTDALRARGYLVEIDTENSKSPKDFDLVHLMNFTLPDMLCAQGQQAQAAGKPFVVTPLCEDVQRFHNRSLVFARKLIEYVGTGQNQEAFHLSHSELDSVPSSGAFDNAWAARNADALLCTGATEGELITSLYGDQANTCVVPVGMEVSEQGDPGLFIREHGVRDFVLCVGRLESRKNQLAILKALENDDITVVFASGGFTYQPEYAEAVTKFQRKGKTMVIGRLSEEMLASAYAAAKVHALLSWYELPGIVSLEAAFHGCNLVASRTGTVEDYFLDLPFYARPDDFDGIRNAIFAAYYAPVSDGLRQRAAEFTWEASADRLIKAYDRILGQSQEVSGRDSDAPDAYFRKAEEHARQRDFWSAHRALDDAEQNGASTGRVSRNRGALYLAENDLEKAKQFFQQAYQADSQDPRTLSGLGMCAMREEQPAEAKAYYVRALQIDPYQLVTLLQLTECSYVLGEMSELRTALERYLEKFQDAVDMRYCYAGCLFRMGDLDGARREVTRALQEQPTHRGALELQAELEKQPAPAQPIARPQTQSMGPIDAIALSPGTTATISQSATSSAPQRQPGAGFDSLDQAIARLEELKQQRKYSQALEGSEAIAKRGDLSAAQRERVWLLRGKCLAVTGDTDSAQEMFSEVLSQNPRSSEGIVGIAALLAHRGAWAEAEREFRRALEIDNSCDGALSGLALCARGKGDTATAWELYQRALTVNAENTRALLGILELGYETKREVEVEAALRNYLDMHPADLNITYSLAGCLYAQHKVSEATSELQKIVLLDPTHEKARELLDIIQDNSQGQSAGMRS